MRKRADSRTGFTLVELIVSMALFTIVVFITTSAFLTLSTLSKKASTTRMAMDNLSVAVESMARNIRTGYTYRCSNGSDFYPPPPSIIAQDCSSGNISLLFYSPIDGVTIGYMLTSNAIIYNRSGGSCSALDCPRLTSSDITITNLKFYVTGAATPDANQPRVNIVVQGTAGTDPKTQSKFNIYTSVTQRAPKF